MSPCVTWRGDDQFKQLKAKLTSVPEGHDVTSRFDAMRFTRETDVLTTGVLYQVQQPTLVDKLTGMRDQATEAKKIPDTRQILETFYPGF